MQHTLRVPLLAALLFMLAFFALPHGARASQVTVVMGNGQFTPKTLGVNVGDTVTWFNQSLSAHSAVADNASFDSGAVQPGQQFSVTFNQAGTYAYHDRANGNPGGVGMAGSIIVGGSVTTPVYVNPNPTYAPTPYAPPVTPSANTAQLYAQVQSLLAQIQALQAQGGVPAGTTGGVTYNSSSCPLVGRSLKLGSSGDDVTRLQQFLARDPSIYPEAQVTGYYGALTQTAVQRWQTKYNIVSSGDAATTGFGVVGPRTAAAISLLCTTGSVNGVSGGGSGATVGGYIQISPISGAAPLTVNVVTTVNTGGSCGGAVYALNFGDGTATQQIPVPAGNCSPMSQTYPHQYIYGGSYQVTLSAGSHTTSATVAVSGSPAPNSGGGGGGTSTTPKGTISAFTTSGTAPLQVTFYVSCASGSAYNVVFGDGTDLGSTAVSGTKCGAGGLDAISHTFTRSGAFHVQLVIFSQQSNGTVTPTTAASVDISVTSVADTYSYNPPQLSPGSTALQFSVQFDLPTACTGYDVSWGDGTANAIQTDGGTNCSQSTSIVTKSHTYAGNGSYTVTVRRGASLSRTDTVAVTVQ